MHEPHMSVVPAQATILYCVIPFLRGSHPLPDQLPGEHTGLQSQVGSASFYRSAL